MMGTKLRGVLALDAADTRMNAQNTGQPHHGGLSPVRGMLAQESTHMAGWLHMKVYSSELEMSSCCSHDAGGRGGSQAQCFLKLWELAWSPLTFGPVASVPLGNPLGRQTPSPPSGTASDSAPCGGSQVTCRHTIQFGSTVRNSDKGNGAHLAQLRGGH